MMNLIKLLLPTLGIGFAYEILPYDFGDEYTKYRFCDNIDEELRNTTIDVFDDFNKRGFTTAILTDDLGMDVIPICNENMSLDRYGYAKFVNKIEYLEIKMYISNRILNIPTTLWNVVYHELLHTVGLAHSKEPGLMNYTVTLTRNYEVIPDRKKLYPSTDDLAGLNFLYDTYINVIEPKNNRHIIKKLNKICALLN